MLNIYFITVGAKQLKYGIFLNTQYIKMIISKITYILVLILNIFLFLIKYITSANITPTNGNKSTNKRGLYLNA